MARNEDDEEWSRRRGGAGGGKRALGGAGHKQGDESESDASDTSDDTQRVRAGAGGRRCTKYAMLKFSEGEVRRFLRSFRRFADPTERLVGCCCCCCCNYC